MSTDCETFNLNHWSNALSKEPCFSLAMAPAISMIVSMSFLCNVAERLCVYVKGERNGYKRKEEVTREEKGQ